MSEPSWLRRLSPSRMVWIVGLGSTLGLVSQTAGFWIVGAFVSSHRLDIQQASLLSTAEMVAIGIVTLALAPVIHRLPHKRVMMAAVLLALVAQLLSAVLPGFGALIATRIVSGIAFGVIYSVATALGAAAEDPQRAYAAAGWISLGTGSLWNPTVGYATEHFGVQGVLGAMSLYCVLLAVPLLFMSFATPRPAQSGGADLSVAGKTPLRAMPIAGVMLIMALFALMTNGVYIFIDQVAERVGQTGTLFGARLTVSSLVSAGGVALLSWSVQRARSSLHKAASSPIARAMPLALSMLAIGGSSLAFMVSPSAWQMYFWLTLWCVVYWAAYSLIMELAAIADPRGRVASVAGSMLILLGGAGSALAGYTAKHFGMERFGLVALLGCAAAAACGIIVSRLLAATPKTVA